MDLNDFEMTKARLSCRECDAQGLALDRNANNGGLRPVCPACGSKTPLAGVQWLKQRMIKGPARGPVETLEVWMANGDHCSFCGKSRALCRRLGIGLTAQHIVPHMIGGEAWPLIPFCARCQQASTAAWEETRRVDEAFSTLDAIIRRIEATHPELVG